MNDQKSGVIWRMWKSVHNAISRLVTASFKKKLYKYVAGGYIEHLELEW